jgi:hypothetical protein
LAAAANASSSYGAEARATAGQVGFKGQNGTDFVITPQNVNCPGTSSGLGCYQVTVTQKLPLYLTRIVGYTGNSVMNNGQQRATTVSAVAIATGKVAYNYCIIGLGTNGNVGPGSGANNVDLSGSGADFSHCAARSNGQVKCTSVDFGIVLAPNQQGGTCGSDFRTDTTTYSDPFANRNISTAIANTLAGVSATPCSTPQPALQATLSAQVTLICASNNTLQQDVTTSGAFDNSVIIVYNTTLNMNGHNLTSATGKGATIIFTGPGTTNLPTWFTGAGTVEIRGASAGAYQDFAVFADPKYTTTQPYNPGGGSHFNINVLGTVYAPNTDLAIQGSMSSTIGSYSCISLIAKSLYVNGGSMDNDPLDCLALGFNLPTTTVTRQALVL